MPSYLKYSGHYYCCDDIEEVTPVDYRLLQGPTFVTSYRNTLQLSYSICNNGKTLLFMPSYLK